MYKEFTYKVIDIYFYNLPKNTGFILIYFYTH